MAKRGPKKGVTYKPIKERKTERFYSKRYTPSEMADIYKWIAKSEMTKGDWTRARILDPLSLASEADLIEELEKRGVVFTWE